jgi:two-component system, OmpR family, phosphate regulon sensor histidine kinase PhoR
MPFSEFILLGLLVVGAVLLLLLRTRARRASQEARAAGQAHAEAAVEIAAGAERDRQSAAYLSSLGEASLDALLLLDADRKILWGNQVAWTMFAVTGNAVGQTFIGLVHDYELNQAVLDATSGGRSIVRQAVVSGRTLRIRAVPVSETGGAAVAIEDVTELQRLGRARRDFVANLSHELRTPLANIDLAAQTLKDGVTRDPALTQRMLTQIQAQVQVLSQLSQEMMDLAQIESGQVLLKLVPTPVAPLVTRAVANLLPQAVMKAQHLSRVVPEDLCALMDEQQVARAIGNLLHNAIKFTPDGGIISVSAEAVDDDIRFCVADSGPGVPPGEQERIFERFYKQDRSRTRGGTGLGLAIARHIVEGHGGRIWVESRPGEGARFYFTLPKA